MLKLADRQTEDFIPDSVQVAKQLVRILRFEVLEQILDVDLDVGLLEGVAVLLLLNVLHAGVLLALLLPVEFLVDVSGRNRYRQIGIRKFHDLI